MRRGDRLRQAQGGVAHQAGVGGGVGGSGVVQLVPRHGAQGRDAGGRLLQPGGGENNRNVDQIFCLRSSNLEVGNRCWCGSDS